MSVEMKDSGIDWIGEIPKHWEVNLLSSLFFEHSLKNTGMLENNLLSLSYGKIIRKNIDENGGLLPASFEGYNIISPNDIVFRLTDLQNDKRSLRTGLCTEKGIITSAYITIRKRNNNLSSRYFHYLLHSYDECKVFYGIGNGVRQGMNYQDLRKLLLVNPPTIEEQSHIANFLDKKCAEIDELIALQEQMIAQLTFYKQAAITETVTKGLDPNVKMKDSGVEWIGEIPEHWKLGKVKNLCREEQYSVKTGPFGTQLKGDDLKEEGDVRVYNQRNVIDSDFDKVQSFVTNEKANSLKNFFTKPQDLLVTTRGTIGRTAILKDGYPMGILHPCLIALRIKHEYDLNWLQYYFKTTCFNTDILLSSNATTIEVIYTENLKKVLLPIPPISEQQSIANYLDQKCKEIDELISVKKEKIEKLKAYKKSVIYEYVTGKKQI